MAEDSNQTGEIRRNDDWREWRVVLKSMNEMLDGTLFDNTPAGNTAYIEAICLVVWRRAEGDNEFKQRCLEEALADAGFTVEKRVPSLAYGTVFLRRIGIITLSASDGRFHLVRPSGESGCLGAILLAIAAILCLILPRF